ncbi:hypothetical protein P9847_12915 [Paenibacillus chibensis]|uniref:Uncharacterized protein n=1 Tax=Paenibacillus chibensis TaxID=59846 RepID=A0ABU6PVM2_9BACL|nr:hypothetical protein [Paenibacillus chibensis]
MVFLLPSATDSGHAHLYQVRNGRMDILDSSNESPAVSIEMEDSE